MLRSLLVSLGTVVALLAVAPPAPADPARAADPSFHQQPVGSCHVLTLKQTFAMSAPASAVPCSAKHTTQTIASPRLTGTVDWKDVEKLYAKVASRCYPALRAVLGTNAKTRSMSAYVFSWWIPTAAERRRGAKWLRCDLNLLGGARIEQLPTDDTPFLTAPPTDSVAHCTTGRLAPTVCARSHSFRATGTVRVTSKKYPGHDRLQRIADRNCPRLTGTSNWRWSSPGEESWRFADRILVCSAQTRK